jgi:3-deoxy-D-arabino-heptulosonate 7-phosphate (DAHP) synthase
MPDNNDDKREMRMMWIASVGIAVLIVGAVGINVLVHRDSSAALPESTQSLTEPPK